VASLLYVSLLKYNKNLEIVPRAAKSFEVLDGGRLTASSCAPASCGTTARS
jgi:peptide/nickel transport system substrate-binding protein